MDRHRSLVRLLSTEQSSGEIVLWSLHVEQWYRFELNKHACACVRACMHASVRVAQC